MYICIICTLKKAGLEKPVFLFFLNDRKANWFKTSAHNRLCVPAQFPKIGFAAGALLCKVFFHQRRGVLVTTLLKIDFETGGHSFRKSPQWFWRILGNSHGSSNLSFNQSPSSERNHSPLPARHFRAEREDLAWARMVLTSLVRALSVSVRVTLEEGSY